MKCKWLEWLGTRITWTLLHVKSRAWVVMTQRPKLMSKAPAHGCLWTWPFHSVAYHWVLRGSTPQGGVSGEQISREQGRCCKVFSDLAPQISVSVLFPLTAFNTVTIANSDSRAGKSDSIASWRVEGSCCRRARRMGDTSLANFGKYNLPQTPCCLVHIRSPHSFVYFVWMFLLLLYWIPPYFFFLSIAAPWHMKVVGLRVE